MKLYQRLAAPRTASVLAFTLTLLAQSFASAQDPTPADPPPEPAPPAETPPPAEPAPVVAAAVVVETPPPATEAPADPPPPAATIASGYVEAAYHRNLSESAVGTLVPLRSYDGTGSNNFLFHAAHLAFKHSFSDAAGLVIELDAGSDTILNTYLYPGNAQGTFIDTQEAFAFVSGGGFTLTAGKFVTYEGIEIVEGPSNPTVTRGFLFGLAEPIAHVGAKLHYATGPLDFGIGLVNGWDVLIDDNPEKTIIWRVGFTAGDPFWVGFSGTYGAEGLNNSTNQRLSLDLTGAIIPSELITIFFQGNYGSEQNAAPDGSAAAWYGVTVQPVLTLGDFSLGGRLEYFVDKDGFRAATDDTNYFNFTIAPGYKLAEGFRLRAEYRLDTASNDVLNGDGNQSTVALAAEYGF